VVLGMLTILSQIPSIEEHLAFAALNRVSVVCCFAYTPYLEKLWQDNDVNAMVHSGPVDVLLGGVTNGAVI